MVKQRSVWNNLKILWCDDEFESKCLDLKRTLVALSGKHWEVAHFKVCVWTHSRCGTPVSWGCVVLGRRLGTEEKLFMGTGGLGDLCFILPWPCNVHSCFLDGYHFYYTWWSFYYTFVWIASVIYSYSLLPESYSEFPLILVANHYGQYNTSIYFMV